MGFFDRLGRLVRANANAAVGAMEDPAKILDQSVADMQADLVKLRQAVATAIASQKRIQNQAEQAEAQAKIWYERAELALKKGEEDLAREALGRRKTCQDTATALNTQLQSQAGQVEQLKQSLVKLESKIAEAKTKKTCSRPGPRRPRPRRSCRAPWATSAPTVPWRLLNAWKRRWRRWRPAVRLPLSWPVRIWKVSLQRSKGLPKWMTNWLLSRASWLAAPLPLLCRKQVVSCSR